LWQNVLTHGAGLLHLSFLLPGFTQYLEDLGQGQGKFTVQCAHNVAWLHSADPATQISSCNKIQKHVLLCNGLTTDDHATESES